MELVLTLSGNWMLNGPQGGATATNRARLGGRFEKAAGTPNGEFAIQTMRDLAGCAQEFDLSDLRDKPPSDHCRLQPLSRDSLARTADGRGRRLAGGRNGRATTGRVRTPVASRALQAHSRLRQGPLGPAPLSDWLKADLCSPRTARCEQSFLRAGGGKGAGDLLACRHLRTQPAIRPSLLEPQGPR